MGTGEGKEGATAAQKIAPHIYHISSAMWIRPCPIAQVEGGPSRSRTEFESEHSDRLGEGAGSTRECVIGTESPHKPSHSTTCPCFRVLSKY